MEEPEGGPMDFASIKRELTMADHLAFSEALLHSPELHAPFYEGCFGECSDDNEHLDGWNFVFHHPDAPLEDEEQA